MNRLKTTNQDDRRTLFAQFSQKYRRANPGWDVQQVNDAAYKEADQVLKRRRKGTR
jgi:hypothetical protein